jgi:hypothetical protein
MLHQFLRAPRIVEDFYDWFSEGLAAPDLMDARALIEALHAH